MDSGAFVTYLTGLRGYAGQVVHVEHIPARNAVHDKLDKPLPDDLKAALKKKRLLPLYRHQAAAVNRVRRGENVMVATSSASGKTLCYNVPVLEALLADGEARALYLFPTKALAQDQLRGLDELSKAGLATAGDYATFDGDTPRADRADIRRQSRIVLTNPDMLHVGVLPNHAQWQRFLRSLKYVVIDEAHAYRGVFGSHLAGIMRRLRRLCRYYGAEPIFICCSATIANPGEHAERLVGLPFAVVDDDGSPHGGKDFVFWNPPIIDPAKSARRSANTEASHLFTELIGQDIRTLTFARTRRLTELIFSYSRDRLRINDAARADRIQPYRAGYLPKERRRIERDLASGKLLGVVATNALELGIDIGTLEATVLSGYPGSIASTWQQAGRSGRGKEEAISFLIGLDNPLDQYFMRHPEFFFGKSFENALVNPENPYIARAHLLCAAWEMPLSSGDARFFGDVLESETAELERRGVLRQRRGRWYPAPSVFYPARSINIRSASRDNYSIIDETSGELLETVEDSVALFQIHEGAIYLHQGDSYLVSELDLATRTARAALTQASYYTQCKELTDVRILRLRHEKLAGRARVCLGELEVMTTITGYKRKAQFTEEVLGEEALDLPPQHFPTVGLWFDLPEEAVKMIDRAKLDFAGGLHATEHAAIGLLPLFALCDRNDIGGVSTPLHPDTGRAQVFIYDAHPGGIGIAEKGYEVITHLWEATLKAVAECPCTEGCPSCIQSPKCGNNNKPLDKKAALLLLEGLLFGVNPR